MAEYIDPNTGERLAWEVECPNCGCCDTTLLKPPSGDERAWFASGRARCNNCGYAFSIRIDEGDQGDRDTPRGPFHY